MWKAGLPAGAYRKIVIVPRAGGQVVYRAMLHPLRPDGFIEPCQPIGAAKPPSGAGWLHEIKLDGFRLMAQRRGVGGRLLTGVKRT
jgi:bifunctional non-homologous end joining protein LigD